MDNKTVLITCAGSGVGQSAIDSLNLSGGFKIIGCDLNRNVYAYQFCDLFFSVPNLYSDKYVDHIVDLCVQQQVDVVIPGHDHELLLFSQNISKFDENKVKVIVSLPDLIQISRDKYKWSKYFKEYSCPVVTTYKLDEFKINPDESIFPAIIKPSGGSASQGIVVVNNIKELSKINENDSGIIQPYLFPKKNDPNYETISKMVENGKFAQLSEISMQLIFSKESEFSGIFISKNILKNGVPVFIDPIIPENFEFLDDIMKFVPVCVENKVKGPVNIQGRITEDGLICFEMNMRFTGITGNRAQLGFNEVKFLVDDILGLPATLGGYAANKLGVRQVACTTVPRKIEHTQIKRVYTILGAGGFIGSHFLYELKRENNYELINIVCRKSSFEKYNSLFSDSKIRILKETDLELESAYCKSDVLINFVGALDYEPDAEKYASILFQYNQIQKIIKAGVPFVINISSQSLYDQKLDVKKDEQAEIVINSLYSFQKYLAEEFFRSITFYSPSTRVVSLRVSRVFGVHYTKSKPKGFFANVIEKLINDQTINIPNPHNKINLIDIRDVAKAILFILRYKEWKNLPNVLNVGGKNMSVKEYCDTVVNCLGMEENNKFINVGNNPEVTVSSMIDSSLLQKYGWSNQYSIEETINNIKTYFRHTL